MVKKNNDGDYVVKLEWTNPPDAPVTHRGAKAFWPTVVEQLKAHPNKWAKIREYPTFSSAYSSARRFGDLTKETEVVARRNEGDDGGSIYGRWIGKSKK